MSEQQPIYIDLDNTSYTDLWKMRAQLPGFKSVTSLRLDEEIAQRVSVELKNSVFGMVGDLSGKDILELGTGVGRFTKDLATRARSVASIDIAEEMLARARIGNGGNVADISNISFLLGDAKNLPFANSCFDVILEVTLLTHIVDNDYFQQIIEESKRVLRKDGFMFFCGPLSSDVPRRKHAHLVLRTFDNYIEHLEPFKIRDIKHHTVVDEDYTLMIARQ